MTNENVQVTGFDNTKLGKNTLTVEYEGKQATFDVEIVSKEIVGIEVNKMPTKTSYIQNSEKLDLTGGVITATYNDETKDTISMTNEKVKVTGFDNTKLGKNTLTVEYEGKQTTFEVNIINILQSGEGENQNNNSGVNGKDVEENKSNITVFPKAGKKGMILIILAVTIVSIILYRKNIKYKDIK